MIDAVVQGVADKTVRARWQKLWPVRGANSSVRLRLADIADDWGTSSMPGAGVMIDLMAFRNREGAVNIENFGMPYAPWSFCDLHGGGSARASILVSLICLLLMAQALPYDSKGARAIAAAINAVVTAEAYATSAELAGLRGLSDCHAENRETICGLCATIVARLMATAMITKNFRSASALVAGTMPGSGSCRRGTTPLGRCADARPVRWSASYAGQYRFGASPKLAIFMESTSQGIGAGCIAHFSASR